MIEKDSRYWTLHKEIYWDELLKLDGKIQARIMDNPECHEAEILEKRVDRFIEEKLEISLH